MCVLYEKYEMTLKLPQSHGWFFASEKCRKDNLLSTRIVKR